MRPAQAMQWLQHDPPLEELCEAFPDEWHAVERDVGRMINASDPQAIKTYLAALAKPTQATPGRRRPAREVLSTQIRRRMAVAAVQRAYLAATTGVTSGRIRFNLVNGYIAQKLLFKRDLERKPVSLPWFRIIWPLLTQQRLLMPLVQPKGIYCFYTRRLITALADMIGDRSCVEIAAGDGTLTRFLTDAGARVTATDDYSWHGSVQYPETVIQQDAAKALRTRRPNVVICSWPPPANTFEEHVFATDSVELYVVIGSREELSAGNWAAYRQQDAFDLVLDERLSGQVLPPEIDPAVYVFRRTRPRHA